AGGTPEEGKATSPSTNITTELLYPSYPTYAHLALLRNRNILYLRRWVRLLLRITRSIHYPDSLLHESTFSLRTLPRFLWEWQGYAPGRVRFEVPAGLVEFDVRELHEGGRDGGERGKEGGEDEDEDEDGGSGGGWDIEARRGGQGLDLFGTELHAERLQEGFWSEGYGGRREGLVRKEDGEDEDEFGDDESGEDDGLEENDEVEEDEEVEDEIKEAFEQQER
ncbi:hypothetical protein KC355_g21418, partial [Hortaea werneckii]